MRAVVLTLHHPWKRSHGGTQRTRALLTALAALGHQVICVHPGSSGPAPDGVEDVGTGGLPVGQQAWSGPLRAVKRRYLPMPTRLGARDRTLSAALAALAPVDLFVAGEIAGVRYRDATGAPWLWLDLPDLLSAAAARDGARRHGLSRRTALAQAGVLDRWERQAAASADTVTAAGWGDAELLAARARCPVRWLPTPVEGRAGPGGVDLPRVAGLFGNFAHLPNLDGYDTLRRCWAPRLRRLGWDVVVAGHDSQHLAPSPHLERLGPVSSPGSFYERVGLTLAPLRLGGGMKVKVIESLAYGRPVVATAAVLDGFPPELRRHVTVADLTEPDFSALPAPVSPGPVALLEQFGQNRFTATVAAALDRLPARAGA